MKRLKCAAVLEQKILTNLPVSIVLTKGFEAANFSNELSPRALMKRLQFLIPILLFISYTPFVAQSSLAADSPCGVNCQVNFTTVQDVEALINEFVGNEQTRATVTRNEETGVFTVTLPNGGLLSLMPVGLTLRNQNTQQQRVVMQTEEGHLHLRSQSGLQMQLRNAFHHEAEALSEMFRAGWRNLEWFRNRMEIDSPSGERMCLGPAMELAAGQPSDNTTILTDDDGRLFIRYRDGIQQHLQACAHDMTQLRDQIRSQLQQQLQVHTDGTISVQLDGQQQRFRLQTTLRHNGILDQPGFFTEQNQLRFRYRDGWEQEIVALP